MAAVRYQTKRNALTVQTALTTALQAAPQSPAPEARMTPIVAAAVTLKVILEAAVAQNQVQTIKDLVCYYLLYAGIRKYFLEFLV